MTGNEAGATSELRRAYRRARWPLLLGSVVAVVALSGFLNADLAPRLAYLVLPAGWISLYLSHRLGRVAMKMRLASRATSGPRPSPSRADTTVGRHWTAGMIVSDDEFDAVLARRSPDAAAALVGSDLKPTRRGMRIGRRAADILNDV